MQPLTEIVFGTYWIQHSTQYEDTTVTCISAFFRRGQLFKKYFSY